MQHLLQIDHATPLISAVHRKLPHSRHGCDIFDSHWSCVDGHTAAAQFGDVTMMCMRDSTGFTLTGLLQDPLTRMLMRSDGVTEQDFSDLMLRVKDSLLARGLPPVRFADVGSGATHA